jgi:[ribosomal protein S18]-alanine N-acetyltransferase
LVSPEILAMSKTSALVTPNLSLRWMIQRDLPRVLRIERQAPVYQWTQQDFLAVFQSGDTAGWVAEGGEEIVGFLIYKAITQPDSTDTDTLESAEFTTQQGARPILKPLRISLLNLAVAPEWHRHGIGRALAAKLNQKLRQPEDYIQATVPESNLPFQLLLRAAGYKAVSILRGYFGTEDAYLLRRQLASD